MLVWSCDGIRMVRWIKRRRAPVYERDRTRLQHATTNKSPVLTSGYTPTRITVLDGSVVTALVLK
jgi:hypothetical protein